MDLLGGGKVGCALGCSHPELPFKMGLTTLPWRLQLSLGSALGPYPGCFIWEIKVLVGYGLWLGST